MKVIGMKFRVILALVAMVFTVQPVLAAGDVVEPPHHHWHFSGPFGQFDKAALQRGLKVYREVCSACHAMKRVRYGDLTALGYTEDQTKNIAAEYSVMDGPNEEGEMFERTARASDPFVSPYPNDNAAKSVNNGAMPPDMSLIVKARHHGPDYIYGLLNGYETGHEVPEGKYWNKYYPGHVIAMANPLSDGMVAYEDDTPETAEQYAEDVVHFLTWASDPYHDKRKRMGIAVLIFLIAFAGVMYALKKKIWEDVH